MMYYNIRKIEPGKRKAVWKIGECSMCEATLEVVRHLNRYLKRYGRRDLRVFPAEVYKEEGHVIDVGMECCGWNCWVWSLHFSGIHRFLEEVCRLISEVVGVEKLLKEGVISVECGGDTVQYELEFLANEFGLRMKLSTGEICVVKGLEETIKFLVNFAIILHNSNLSEEVK